MTSTNIDKEGIPDTELHRKLRKNFKTFLYHIHNHLGLPEPTPVQLDIADYLQGGPKRSVVQAYRGAGKSHLTAGYVVWRLLRDPEEKILVVSASKERADAFSIFCQRLIWDLEGLEYLKPKSDQRQSKISFDVGPATASQSPSVKSVGITSQITGSRADLIIADDVEVLNNSGTQQMRDKLSESIKEFDAVLKPLPSSRVLFLGTPQTEDSLYMKLPERGYEVRIWPARMPNEDEMDKYGNSLAPYIRDLGLSPGDPTDPLRFDDADLIEREASYGKAGFAMQFMLSTQLSDMERFPLKVRDLIMLSVDKETAPLRLTWGPLEDKCLNDLPNAAMRGDRFYPPMSVGDVFSEYTGCVMSIDPSGRGADETGYAIVKMLNGYLYVVACGGLQGGYEDTTLLELATLAKDHKVNHVIVESNFGDGMYVQLLKPVLTKIYPVLIEEVRHSKQKERRIIDTLEPVLMRHRLVMDPQVVLKDFQTAQKNYEGSDKYQKTLIYQMTRITAEKGSLRHDDRLDALSIAVAYFTEQMARDELEGEKAFREEALDRELERFLESAKNPVGSARMIGAPGTFMDPDGGTEPVSWI